MKKLLIPFYNSEVYSVDKDGMVNTQGFSPEVMMGFRFKIWTSPVINKFDKTEFRGNNR